MKNLILLLLLTGALRLYAQQHYTFTHFNKDDGLADNYVERVFEDRFGFIWVGTQDGLNRFDGKNFKTYRFYDDDGTPEIRNYVTCLIGLDTTGILVGTLNGIYKYFFKSDTILKVEDHKQIDSKVESFVKDKNGDIWIATNSGLLRYNPKNDNLEKFTHKTIDPRSLLSSFLYTLYLEDDYVWVGSDDGGLDRFSIYHKKATHYNKKNNGVPGKIIRALFLDNRSRLWVTSSYVGVFVRDNTTDTFEKVQLIDKNTNEEILPNFSSVEQDIHGNIWIGTYDKGLFVLDPESGNMEHYTEDSEPPFNISGNSIDNIFRDSNGIMWVSTHGGGISVYTPRSSSFKYFRKSIMENGLPGKFISCFWEDDKNNIWIGTDGKGFSCYNPLFGDYINYSTEEGLSSDAVLDIEGIGNNKIAIGTWNGGLNIFDMKTKRFERHLYKKNSTFELQNHIKSFYYDTVSNYLWCATFNRGMQIFDITQNRFLTEDELNEEKPYWFVDYLLSQIYPDEDSSVWVADSYYLYRINDSTRNYSRYQPQGCDSVNSPVQIIRTSKNELWVGSNKGLFFYDSAADCFYKVPDTLDYLYDIKAIVEDRHGDLWITSASGVNKFNVDTYSITNISKNWGAVNMQYVYRSCLRSRDGWLYFGGVNGYVSVHEDSVYNKKIEPPIFFTDLTIYKKSKHKLRTEVRNITLVDTIQLSYEETFFNISYAALNYFDNIKSKYRYKLEGFDKDWIYAGSENKVSYTNLSPGSYKFVLNSTNSIGEWSTNEKVLYISIMPPWWNTLLFKIFISALAVAFIVFVIIFREKKIKQRNKMLTHLVDVKTNELQSTNDMLKNANIQLKQQKEAVLSQNENLRENQLVIELKNSQLQEALDTKDRLITMIVHDLRNPLSTLFAFSKLLFEDLDKLTKEELVNYTSHIINSSEKLLIQVENLMDWAIGKSVEMRYSPVDLNPAVLVADTVSLLYETALRKDIKITTEYNFDSLVCVDPRMMSTVFRNLISNSIKFTQRGGKIRVTISETDQSIVLRFEDTGIGIASSRIATLFDKKNNETNTTFGTEQEKGSGIGLALVKQFVERNNGIITVESTEGEGTVFEITLNKSEQKVFHHVKGIADRDELNEEEELELDDSELTMLVIDDNVEITGLLHTIFQGHFKVVLAHDGKEGLSLAQSVLPDIIISDVDMPVLDGKQMCNDIKTNALTNHIPVILISAHKQAANQIDGYFHLADDYIIKPFNPDILKQKVFAILKNRELLNDYFQKQHEGIEEKVEVESYEDKIVKSAIELINEHYANHNFSVAFLADKLGLSRVQLYRKFKATTGYMPIEYIKDVRLKKAAAMLKTGKFRVSDVAYEVGFSDPKYFSSCFRKEYGVSPRDYS